MYQTDFKQRNSKWVMQDANGFTSLHLNNKHIFDGMCRRRVRVRGA